MCLYKVNGKPSLEKIKKYDEDYNTFYRFQCKDWEMGTKSWGMIFSSEEDAIENCEEYGMTPEEAVLPGKSACYTAKELMNFIDSFDKDFRVLVLNGTYICEGHDGEDVVDVDEVLEIWDFDEFVDFINEMEEV